MMLLVRPAALAAGLVLLAGCGGSAEGRAVTGTVALGGQPLARVTLSLVPEVDGGAALSGASDDAGAFALLPPVGTAVRPGSYKVVVSDPNPKGRGGRADDPIADQKGPGNPPIPAKYTRPDTTTAKVTVEAGKPVTIELTP